jgi:hypothetical protein
MQHLSSELVETMITEAMAADDWSKVDMLAGRLDEMGPPRPPVPAVSAALWYAEQGFLVFPLQPRSKQPYGGTNGFKDATRDSGGILTWWRHRPSSNIGIATGHVCDVIDIDGPAGVRAWARMDDLPPVLGVVSTPRPGGSHLYIAATGLGNRAGIADHVDYRGIGGYVVAPPSYVVETSYEGSYTWRRKLTLPMDRRCQKCGLEMVILEEGQTTHPSCDLVPS